MPTLDDEVSVPVLQVSHVSHKPKEGSSAPWLKLMSPLHYRLDLKRTLESGHARTVSVRCENFNTEDSPCL